MTYLQHRGGTTGAAVAVLQAQMDEITAEPGDIVSHDAAVFFDGAYWTNETGATVILPDPITPAALSSLGLIPGQAVAGRWRQHSLQSFSVNLVAGARTMLDLTGLTTTSQNFEPTLLGHDFFAGGVFRPTKFATQFDLRMNFKVVSSLIDNSLKFELDIGGTQGVIDTHTEACHQGPLVNEVVSPQFSFFCLNTFLANGGSIYCTSRSDAVLSDCTALVIAGIA